MLRPERYRWSPLVGCCLLTLGCTTLASPEPASRRALVVGIDRYVTPTTDPAIREHRRLRNLHGAVRDARTLAEVLEHRGYVVERLFDDQATRAGIQAALQRHLIRPSRSGDDLVFFFAGHGSRVPDLDQDENEGFDETLVPFDAGIGAEDLRDDDLGRLLAAASRRGARMTVLLDACHGGSAARGLPPVGRPRAIDPSRGMSPGAQHPTRGRPASPRRTQDAWQAEHLLVLAAAQNFQKAYETVDSRGRSRGVFTHALLSALTAKDEPEPSIRTLRRVAASIAADGWAQRPMIAGAAHRQRAPLFAPKRIERNSHGPTRRSHRPTAIVLGKTTSGRILLEGGWTRGLRPGDVLTADSSRIVVTHAGPVRSDGNVLDDLPAPAVGTVLTRQHGHLSDEPDLRVSWSESDLTAAALLAFDRQIHRLADAAAVDPVADPWQTPPSHVLSYAGPPGWVMTDRHANVTALGPSPDEAELSAAIARLPKGSRLFVELPLPRSASRYLPFHDQDRREPEQASTVALVEPSRAHYRLVGLRLGGALAHVWSRAEAGDPTTDRSPLPIRTREVVYDDPERWGLRQTELALKLARIRFWLTIESPPAEGFPFRLALRLEASPSLGSAERLVESDADPNDSEPRLRFGERFGLVLLGPQEPAVWEPRYVYVVLLDSNGRRQLLYPHVLSGTLDNLHPDASQQIVPPPLAPLGRRGQFTVSTPAGRDTYILLTTNEPLPDPSVLADDGVRSARSSQHPLARLILQRHRGRRGPPTVPDAWSIERLSVIATESVERPDPVHRRGPSP